MSQISNYVPKDGYTLKGYIAAEKGIHNEFRFEYRPMMTEQKVAMNNGLTRRAKDPLDQERFLAKLVAANHLVSWDLFDERGDEVPVSANAILENLLPPIWTKICSIVMQAMPSDVDPSADDESKDQVFNEVDDLKN